MKFAILLPALVSGLLGLAGTVGAQETAPPAAALPNGASSITENFGDWTLNCAVQDGSKVCTIGQAQGNPQTGRQVFGVELRAPLNGTAEGVLLMPFGLAVRDTVTLKIDEQVLGQGAQFSTCIPAGCLVPLSLPAAALDALKAGTSLNVSASVLAAGQEPAQFAISLSGFTAALARITELAQ